MQKSDPYSTLALVYDHLMRKIRYDKWADYLHTLVKDDIEPSGSILELAAGNCKFTEYFKIHYPNIMVTDISKSFMKNACTTYKRLCCNMTKLPFKNKFDLIYCNFDSVNYLLTSDELTMLFSEVNRILKNDGLFTFDVSLENNSYKHEREVASSQRIKGIRYSHLSRFNSKTRIHTNKFIIKLTDGTQFSEIHKQKIYPFHKYFEIIPKTGLYVSQCYETFTFNEGNPASDRIQFILRKNINASI